MAFLRQVLNLEGNSLTSLPDTVISSLRSLEKLDLRANLLETLPAAALGALPRLQELLLRDNRLPDLYMDKVRSQDDPRWLERVTIAMCVCFPQAEHGTLQMLEFLHEEGIRLAAEAAEKLRPVGVANGPFIEYDLLSVEGASEKNLPEIRAGYAIVQVFQLI